LNFQARYRFETMGHVSRDTARKGPKCGGERFQGEFSAQVRQNGRVCCHIRDCAGHRSVGQGHSPLHGHADQQDADGLLLQLKRNRS